MGNYFQRVGSISNAHAGREFEEATRLFFAETGSRFSPDSVRPFGHKIKKPHKFDLGSEKPPTVVQEYLEHHRQSSNQDNDSFILE